MFATDGERTCARDRLAKAIFDVLLADVAYQRLPVKEVRSRAFDAAHAATEPSMTPMPAIADGWHAIGEGLCGPYHHGCKEPTVMQKSFRAKHPTATIEIIHRLRSRLA